MPVVAPTITMGVYDMVDHKTQSATKCPNVTADNGNSPLSNVHADMNI